MLVARSDLNALRPRLTVPQPVSLFSTELFIAGIAPRFVRGDRVLITGGPRLEDEDGNIPSGVDVSLLNVLEVDPQFELGRTRLALEVLAKFPPRSQPPAPTEDEPEAPTDFTPPKPPPVPPVKPAELDPPVFALVQRPLTDEEIRRRILDYLWTDAQLLAQAATQWWNPSLMARWVEHHRRGPDLGPVSTYVKVKPATDTKRPMVISSFPNPGATNVHNNTTIIVAFSEPMDRQSLVGTPAGTGAVSLREGSVNGDRVAVGALGYDEATGSARMGPQITLEWSHEIVGDVLKSGTTYFIVVTTAAKDKNGLTLGAQFVSSFTVADSTPPVPTKQVPEPFKTDVPATTTVEATFDDPINETTVKDTSVFLRDATGTRVPSDVRYDADTNTVRLTPRATLALSTTYTATLTDDIMNIGELPNNPPEPIAVLEWQFTTAKRPEDVPDPVLRVHGFGEHTAFFGHNAPKWSTLPEHENQRGDDPYPVDWDEPRSIWVDSQGSTHGGDTVYLDREVADLEPKSWAVFETETGAAAYYVSAVSVHSVADYGISGRASRLQLSNPDGTSPSEGSGTPPDFRVRETTAHVRSELLELVELPVTTHLMAGDKEITLDRMVIGLENGRLIALHGMLVELSPLYGNEILVLDHAEHASGFTTLVLKDGLAQSYVRPTVTLNANVVPATHGETVRPEVLGGGDGAQANQRFALRRPPLTYVSAKSPSGAASTLEVRVDGVRWDEAPVLYGLGPRSRSYIVRRNDDNVATVIFGDGEQGARPSTGTENIVATYRTGIGSSGMLGPDRLTLMLERPLGITAVNNPLPTTGAGEPENRDNARENAPLTVLTMERIVSLRDFEDFARGFAGIGKAQVIALWSGDKHRIHLTVAPDNGAPISDGSALFENLKSSVHAASEPGLDVTVALYQPRYFDLHAAVRLDPAYVAQDVLTAARNAVLATFSFERRSFGQAVTAAEVVTVIQTVSGVVATYLNALYRLGDQDEVTLAQGVDRPLEDVLFAQTATLTGVDFTAAELLLVNPAGVTITERTA
jgi:hypothetical protein